MRVRRRLFITAAVAVAIAAMPAYSQNVSIDTLQKSADALAETLASSLPFNSTAGLNWSDAYIGQFIGLPPHFGVGIVGGATTIDSKDLVSVLESLGYADTGDISGVFPMPVAAIEGRIGGFVLPFDLGLKIGFIPDSVSQSIADSGNGLSVDYLLFGLDARYQVYKGSFWLPMVSVGVGFNYLRGGVTTTVSGGQKYTFSDPVNGAHEIEVTDPEVGLEWNTKVIDFKVQASKKLLIFTPYVGLGLSHGSSETSYFVNSDVKYDGTKVSDAQVQQIISDLKAYNSYLAAAGQSTFDIPDVSATGIESSTSLSGWSTRFFGGVSLNLFVLKGDFTLLYNFSDGAYGGTFGLRFQL